jgi:hypothetical protein
MNWFLARVLTVAVAAAGLAWAVMAQAPTTGGSGLQPVVESYYKLAPGKADDWLELYRKQHLPILKQRQTDGHILEIVIYRPFLHLGEPPWDYKVILVYRDFAALGDRISFDAIERRLYPDWEAHQRAERHRWEITEKHWDDLMVRLPAD